MAHMIMDDNRFAERDNGKRAWHHLGEVAPADYTGTVREFMELAGVGYKVIKVPELFRLPNGDTVETGQFLLYREDHLYKGTITPGKIISKNSVSKSYTVLDNMAIADVVQPLADQWQVETVGALNDGAVMFLALDAGEFDVKGDPMHMYFTVSDGKDGLRSLRVDVTPIRVVCNNTLQLGIAQSTLNIKVEHTLHAGKELGFWAEVIPQIRDSARRTREVLDMLANTKATKAHAGQVFLKAFPDPKTSDIVKHADLTPVTLSEASAEVLANATYQDEYHTGRMKAIREMAWDSLDLFNQQNPDTANTLFAVTQAATEVSCWRKGHESRHESIVFGSRADESKRAFREAVDIMTKGKGLVLA